MTFKNYKHTLLPNQKILTKFYNGSSKTFYDDLFKFITSSSDFIIPKKKYKIKSSHLHTIEEMASNPLALSFYNFIVSTMEPKNILEIGCFIGLSTMEFANASSNKCQVYTIEKFKHFADIANNNFKNNNLEKQIILLNGDANDILKKHKFKVKFDIIFIDGNKENYKQIFELSEKLISQNGIFIIDNIFNQGDVFNKKAKTKKGQGVKMLINYLKKRNDLHKSILPFYDGIMLVKKIKHVK